MRKTFAAVTIASLSIIAFPETTQASDKFWWGVGGLVAGSTIGYVVGRDVDRRPVRTHHYHHPQPYYYQSQPYYRDGLPVMYSPGYYEEDRFWPFYRRTRHYPIAGTAPVFGTPQSVSNRDMFSYRMVDEQPVMYAEPTRESQPINITVGDNNENVQINIGGEPAKAQEDRTEVVIRPQANTSPNIPRGRVVDQAVVVNHNSKEVRQATTPRVDEEYEAATQDDQD